MYLMCRKKETLYYILPLNHSKKYIIRNYYRGFGLNAGVIVVGVIFAVVAVEFDELDCVIESAMPFAILNAITISCSPDSGTVEDPIDVSCSTWVEDISGSVVDR